MGINEDKINVIAGAGLTGISVGYMLARSGKKCLILEKEAKAGGMAQSIVFNGCVFDFGPHVLYSKDSTPAAKLVREIIPEEESVVSNWKLNFLMDGKYYGYPLRLPDFFRLPLGHCFSFLQAVINAKPTDSSFKNNIISCTGNRMYESFFRHYIDKKTGLLDGGEKLHEDWWRRAKRNYRNDVLRGKFANVTDRNKAKGPWGKILLIADKFIKAFNPQEENFYPHKGIEDVAAKLLAAYKNFGGQIIFNVKDIKLCTQGGKVDSVVFNDNQYKVNNLIWTGAITEVCFKLSIDCSDLQYANSGVVFVVLNKKLAGKRVSCSYFPDPSIIFSRIYYPSYFYKGTVPQGKDALCVEFLVENEIAKWPVERIIEKTKSDLQKLNICKISEIESVQYMKLNQSYPIYSLDYESKLKKIFKQLQKYDNLYSIGRLGGFYFCLMYDAINQGIETAEHILLLGRKPAYENIIS